MTSQELLDFFDQTVAKMRDTMVDIRCPVVSP